MTTTVKHPDRLAEQVNNILTNRGSWNQKTCHSPCGTKHCIAGHGQIASGRPLDDDACADDAQAWYGLTDDDAEWLFLPHRTLTELYEFARLALAGEAYFDADGFDRSGFDRNGFDRGGFRRDVFDRYRFDRYGYARDGYDRDGFDRGGFNRDGYDRHGDSMPILKIAAGDTQ